MYLFNSTGSTQPDKLNFRQYNLRGILVILALTITLAGCDSNLTKPTSDSHSSVEGIKSKKPTVQNSQGNTYEFSPPVFDIEASPNGGVLVAETVFPETEIPSEGEESISTIKEIRKNGGVHEVAEISTVQGSPINGLEAIGQYNFLATGGGLDQGVGAKVFRITPGNAILMSDIEAYENQNDPDAFEGLQWKNQACEENPGAGFTAGPQSNPYHLTKINGQKSLVADAAGNSLYRTQSNGNLDLVATFSPPTEEGLASSNPEDWLVLFPLGENSNCYVQPVPTSVAVAPNGDYYVGELTGVTPADIGVGESPQTGLSRVWRIDQGASNVVCPSANCKLAFSGFTSILDIAFGPDGDLYVVEYDEAGWFTATEAGAPTSGTINRCNTSTENCEVLKEGLQLPSALTFDKWGNLWLLENNIIAPVVRQLDMNN